MAETNRKKPAGPRLRRPDVCDQSPICANSPSKFWRVLEADSSKPLFSEQMDRKESFFQGGHGKCLKGAPYGSLATCSLMWPLNARARWLEKYPLCRVLSRHAKK